MKKFLAMYMGSTEALEEWRKMSKERTKEEEKAGMAAWSKWATDNKKSIVDNGFPLGKTKRVDVNGISDIRNEMGGYTIVQANSHDEAAKLFLDHPHFTMFPGERVEIMELLPME